MQNPAKFHSSCVEWDRNTLDDLSHIVDANESITRDCFMRNVDKEERKLLESRLGYASNYKQGLTIAGDWHVTYHKSEIRGTSVYYLRHSGIEYVFVKFPGITYAEESDNF